jgi:hypothetical protein
MATRTEPDDEATLPEFPGEFTIDQVKEWVTANPDQAEEVLDAEYDRDQPRSSLVSWLEKQIENRDG